MSWKGWGKPWRINHSADGYAEQYSSFSSSGQGKGKHNRAEDWQGYNPKKDAKASFPAYNAQPKQEIAVVAEKRMHPKEADPEEDVIKAIQRAVNSARKAEQKVSKLQSDLAKGQSQWQTYEIAIRKAYLAEKSKFQQDQAKLRTELSEALMQQVQTRHALRTAAIGHVQDGNQDMMVEGSQEADDFLALMQDTTIVEPAEQKEELDGWLKDELDKIGSPGTAAAAKARIVAAMKGGGAGPHQVPQVTPKRPTQGGISSPAVPPPKAASGGKEHVKRALLPFGGAGVQTVPPGQEYLQATSSTQYRQVGPAITDPYLTSPSASVLPEASGVGVTPPSAKSKKTPRSGVKDLAKPRGPAHQAETTSKTSLAEKLAATRRMATQALHEEARQPPKPVPVFIFDDNGDEPRVPSGSDLDLLDG